MTYLNYILDM